MDSIAGQLVADSDLWSGPGHQRRGPSRIHRLSPATARRTSSTCTYSAAQAATEPSSSLASTRARALCPTRAPRSGPRSTTRSRLIRTATRPPTSNTCSSSRSRWAGRSSSASGATAPRLADGTTGSDASLTGGGKATAGLYDDPFYFDLDAFKGAVLGNGNGRTFCDGDTTDFFKGLNISAIVLRVPNEKSRRRRQGNRRLCLNRGPERQPARPDGSTGHQHGLQQPGLAAG